MKSLKEIRKYAQGVAEGHFYCDDKCRIPWEPFENWDTKDVRKECAMLATAIERAMLWSQGKSE